MADFEVGDYVEYYIGDKQYYGIVREKHPIKNVITKQIIRWDFDVEQLGDFNIPNGSISTRHDDELVKKDPPRVDQVAYDAWMRSKDPARRRMDAGLRDVFGRDKPKRQRSASEDDVPTEPDGSPVDDSDDDYALSVMFPDADFWSFLSDWNED